MTPHKCENNTCDNITTRPRYCSDRCCMMVNNRNYRKMYREKTGVGVATKYYKPALIPTKSANTERQPVTYRNGVTVNTHERAERLRAQR